MFKQSKYVIFGGVALTTIILIVVNLYFPNNNIVFTTTAVLGSIIASIVISIFYNDELHRSLNMYKEIGLNGYFKDFESVQDKIRKKISTAKDVDIYVMYAGTFLNSSSVAFKDILSRRECKIRIFLYSERNLFLASYGNQWGFKNNDTKYDLKGLKDLIGQVKKDMITIYDTIDENKRGKLEIYEILDAPISYSFYKIDNELFYVPSKNTKFKTFKLPVYLFKNTKNDSCMYSKVESEINTMLNNKELNQIF